MTQFGGANDDGTIFKIAPSGKLTMLHSFSEADGRDPTCQLLADDAGNLFGTTIGGGTKVSSLPILAYSPGRRRFGNGAVFKLTFKKKRAEVLYRGVSERQR